MVEDELFVADGADGVSRLDVSRYTRIPELDIDVVPTSVREDDTNGFSFTINFSIPAPAPLTINYSIGGTAGAEDYTGAVPGSGQTLTVSPGQPQVVVQIIPVDDNISESDETVIFSLDSGAGYTLAETSSATATITNFDRQPVDRLTTPFYRFQNLDRPGTYLFAAGEEAANLRINHPNYKEEGFAFAAASAKTDPLLRPFYRFENTDPRREGTYLYVGEQEAASLRQNYPSYKENGLAFFAYDYGFGQGSIDFARFENINLPGTFLFTGPSETQSLVLSSTFAGGSGYSYGGLAFAAAG